jgi:hypothetical protein
MNEFLAPFAIAAEWQRMDEWFGMMALVMEWMIFNLKTEFGHKYRPWQNLVRPLSFVRRLFGGMVISPDRTLAKHTLRVIGEVTLIAQVAASIGGFTWSFWWAFATWLGLGCGFIGHHNVLFRESEYDRTIGHVYEWYSWLYMLVFLYMRV